MRINHNISAQIAAISLSMAGRDQAKSLHKLSTGLRINSAADDAAGLGVSENLRTQVRGNTQAMRNAQDAISMLQIGEGALNEIHSVLQRCRELSIQAANDTLSATERGYIQNEIAALISEVDRIGQATTFNKIQVLQSTVDSAVADAITNGMQQSWLSDAVALVRAGYNLSGNGTQMTVILDQSIGWATAYVSFTQAGQPMELHIDASSSSFNPGYAPGTPAGNSGGTSPFFSDRILAHEMTHALMADNILNASTLPTWFMEGAAEFIQGADERVASSLGTVTPTAAQAQNLINSAPISGPWQQTSDAYSVGYAAVKYLDTKLAAAGNSMGDLMAALEASGGGSAQLGTAISALTGGAYADINAFYADFQGGSGAAYIASMNLADADTGSIGGGDPLSVVPNSGAGLPAPDFTLAFSPVQEDLQMQVDANSGTGSSISVATSGVSSSALNISGVDVTTQSGSVSSITSFDNAIDTVSQVRTGFGAYINRFEHAINNLSESVTDQQFSESLVRDTDFAAESARFARSQILGNAATAMLAQANMQTKAVLTLISGASGG